MDRPDQKLDSPDQWTDDQDQQLDRLDQSLGPQDQSLNRRYESFDRRIEPKYGRFHRFGGRIAPSVCPHERFSVSFRLPGQHAAQIPLLEQELAARLVVAAERALEIVTGRLRGSILPS